MTNIPYMLPSHVHHLLAYMTPWKQYIIYGNNLFKEPYMSLSSHVHHFALVINIYDLVIFIDVDINSTLCKMTGYWLIINQS